MARITGIGGVFFKSTSDTAALAAWYRKHLGMPLEDFGGAILRWPDDKAEDRGLTVWHVAAKDSKWFSPSHSSFMINYRVDDLGALLDQLRAAGVDDHPGTRVPRERQVRVDHGPGQQQDRALGAESVGRQEQGCLRAPHKLLRSLVVAPRSFGRPSLSEIVMPNDDGLFDPTHARTEAQRMYGKNLGMIEEVREYACGLPERITDTRASDLEDLGLATALLRQALVGLDGRLVLANEGAAQAARTAACVVWEAALYQRWLFMLGRVRWARQLYVSYLRRGRQTARRIIKDAEEHRQYEAAWAAWRDARTIRARGILSADTQGRASDREAQDLLESPHYESINRDFESELATGPPPMPPTECVLTCISRVMGEVRSPWSRSGTRYAR